MLQLTIPAREFYDEETGLFINSKEQTLSFEHSLISLSKWESRWHKPFLKPGEKTEEEVIDYIRCMCVNRGVDDLAFKSLTQDQILAINNYIEDPMTATTINMRNQKPNREILTSEVIYYMMATFNIPFECEKWHLNRLITLIEVCAIKNSPDKKMSKRDTMSRNAALNRARRAKHHSKG